jgi:lysophospholipase L1-like esterase
LYLTSSFLHGLSSLCFISQQNMGELAVRPWMLDIMAIVLFPLLAWQARQARRHTPPLPLAIGPTHGVSEFKPGRQSVANPPLSLLAIGESVVAGVGVATQYDAIGAQFASALSRGLKATIEWRAHGLSGATIATANKELLSHITPHHVDLVTIMFGVNDAVAFRQSAAYRRDAMAMLLQVQQKFTPSLIVVTGIPPVHAMPNLPQPLRYVLGQKARILDARMQDIVRMFRDKVPLMYCRFELNVNDPTLLSRDRYHPSERGVLALSRNMANLVAPELLARTRASDSATKTDGQ